MILFTIYLHLSSHPIQRPKDLSRGWLLQKIKKGGEVNKVRGEGVWWVKWRGDGERTRRKRRRRGRLVRGHTLKYLMWGLPPSAPSMAHASRLMDCTPTPTIAFNYFPSLLLASFPPLPSYLRFNCGLTDGSKFLRHSGHLTLPPCSL